MSSYTDQPAGTDPYGSSGQFGGYQSSNSFMSGDDYGMGDVVAYHNPELGLVMHRVIVDNGDRVIKTGLEPNERVIVEGLMRARNGIKVTPETGAVKPPVPGTAQK